MRSLRKNRSWSAIRLAQPRGIDVAPVVVRAQGVRPQFMAVNSGAAQMAQLLGPDAKGLIFTQVVPFPWAVAVSVVKEYQQALARATPARTPSLSGLEGYLGAKVWSRACAPPAATRAAPAS